MCNFALVFVSHAHTHIRMRFAIIAAGEGSRLRNEGVNVPKPLVTINGEHIIDRLVRIFCNNGASEIMIVCNDLYPEVVNHIHEMSLRFPIRYVVKTTASSMHSLKELEPLLVPKGSAAVINNENEKFIVTTVDTIFDEEAFTRYVNAFRASRADAFMAVTDYIDDEKPLYVDTRGSDSAPYLSTDCGANGIFPVHGFLDTHPDYPCPYISAGIYGLTTKALDTLNRCILEGQHRMRNFQRGLLQDGLDVRAFLLGKVFDIDHVTDICKARLYVGIYRHQQFSPNKAHDDRAILERVIEKLKEKGHNVTTITEEELLKGVPLPMAERYFSMARSPEVLEMLKGRPCINNSEGINICCNREYIPQDVTPTSYPLWIKRANGCTETKDDVTFCSTEEEKLQAIKSLHNRGIDKFIVQPHYEGDLIKFYGVLGTDFFHLSYPTESKQSKFGLEKKNNAVRYHPFSKTALIQQAEHIANATGVRVYGGDAIITSQGDIHIIDFNDWPSFSSCREEAAKAIVQIGK